MHWSTRFHILIGAAAVASVPVLILSGVADGRLLWLLLPCAVGWLVARRAIEPLREIEDVAKRLQDGEWQARPAGRYGAPWHTIASAMTDLADRYQTVSKDMEQQVGERTAQLQRKAGQLRALGMIGRQVAAVREPGELLHYVVRLVRGTFGYDFVAIVQHHGSHLITAACAMRGVAEPPVGRVFSLDDPAVMSLTRAMQTDGPAAPAAAAPVPFSGDWEARSELIVPIRHGRRTLGAMVVQSASPDGFDEDDIFTVDTIAGQIAVALENARLFESEGQLRRLAITEERNRIAREIHDTLAQGFMGILIHLRAMQGAQDDATASMHRREAELLAQESLHEARRSVWNLRPARLHDRDLVGALEDELDRLQRQSHLHATLHVTGDEDGAASLPADTAATLLRVGQEALHNVVKHAHAREVAVTLHVVSLDNQPGATVELVIQHDGVGFVHPPPHGEPPSTFGLIGMRERVAAAGGTLHIQSKPNEGTTIRVCIPSRAAGDPPKEDVV